MWNAGHCKVCNSEHLEYINSLISNGTANKKISEILKEKGVDISHMCIARHKTKHLGLGERIRGTTRKESVDHAERIDYKTIEPIKLLEQTLKIKDHIERFKSFSEILHTILSNQLTIVARLQEFYMEGKIKYPQDEIRGLAQINDILVKFHAFMTTMPNVFPLNLKGKTPSEQANEINQAIVKGKISVEAGTKLLSALSTTANIIKFDEFEKRLAALEELGNEHRK